jgi:hypothetical protein
MKFMMMVKLDSKSEAARDYAAGAPPDEKLEVAMAQFREKLVKSGTLLDTGGLLPLAQGARIKTAGGKLTITDGPFIESKEVIGGYAILQTKSKEEAVQLGKEFMRVHVDILGPSYEGELEIRQLFE